MRDAPSVFVPSVVLMSLVIGLSAGPADADVTLASVGFEGDAVGAVAAPGGPLTCVEPILDRSNGVGGDSQVVEWTGGKRYRVADHSTPGLSRGLRAPLASTVSTGTLVVAAVVTAEQTDGGGVLGVSDPYDEEWLGRTAFGADGKFAVHGSPTGVVYAVDHRYRVTMTLNLSGGTVDYSVTDLETNLTVLDSRGHPCIVGVEAANVVFATGDEEEGAFTFDDLLATR